MTDLRSEMEMLKTKYTKLEETNKIQMYEFFHYSTILYYTYRYDVISTYGQY